HVTGVQTCALPISGWARTGRRSARATGRRLRGPRQGVPARVDPPGVRHRRPDRRDQPGGRAALASRYRDLLRSYGAQGRFCLVLKWWSRARTGPIWSRSPRTPPTTRSEAAAWSTTTPPRPTTTAT